MSEAAAAWKENDCVPKSELSVCLDDAYPCTCILACFINQPLNLSRNVFLAGPYLIYDGLSSYGRIGRFSLNRFQLLENQNLHC